MLRRRPHLTLLTRFSLLSLLVTVITGAVLAGFMDRVVDGRAVGSAERLGQAIALSGVQDRLDPGSLRRGLSRVELDQLDAALRDAPIAELGVLRVKVFNSAGRLVYSDDRSQIGSDASRVAGVATALRGAVSSKLENGTDHSGTGREVIEVYVPMRAGGRTGVFEIYLDYAGFAAAARDDRRTLFAALLGGLALLWLAVFRVVAGASRSLRRQAVESHAQARRDALTGLSNRLGLQDLADAALERGDSAALLLIDLDHFKEVNDTLGHGQGDHLLMEVAARLRGLLGESAPVARLGGDEFGCLLTGVAGRAEAMMLAQAVREAIAAPVELRDVSIRLGSSIGIAMSGEHGVTLEELLKHADVAMYDAKADGDSVRFYEPGRDPYSEERLVVAAELRCAVEREQLRVHYQPIVDADEGRLRGVEALVRWDHPARGLLGPGDFLPLAERTGTIGAITRFVIEQAVSDAYAWRQHGHDLEVACNLASASASDPELPEIVASALDRWPIEPDRLTLELSEDTVITDPRRVAEVLARLHALGVRLALDDFGTGQSSLAFLHRLPLHQLKIDRSFVSGMRGDGGEIVRSMLTLARSYRLQTVAEGVEDRSTAAALRELGCDRLQGYHFNAPLSREDLEARWLVPSGSMVAGLGDPAPAAGARAARANAGYPVP